MDHRIAHVLALGVCRALPVEVLERPKDILLLAVGCQKVIETLHREPLSEEWLLLGKLVHSSVHYPHGAAFPTLAAPVVAQVLREASNFAKADARTGRSATDFVEIGVAEWLDKAGDHEDRDFFVAVSLALHLLCEAGNGSDALLALVRGWSVGRPTRGADLRARILGELMRPDLPMRTMLRLSKINQGLWTLTGVQDRTSSKIAFSILRESRNRDRPKWTRISL